MKTAVVTGGSRGIGRAISLELAAAGHRVVMTYQKDASSADAAAAEIRSRGGEAHAIAADVRDAAAVKAVGERVSRDFGGPTSSSTTPGSSRTRSSRSSRKRTGTP